MAMDLDITVNVDVLAAREGDMAAFARLVQQWQGTVCAIGLGVVQDVSASEDIAQDVFLAAWSGLAGLRNPASFGAWLRQLTRNKALAYRRATVRREQRVVADGDAVDRAAAHTDLLLAAEQHRIVQDALDALPDDARDVMILYYREGHSAKQVAELLDLSVDAVKKRLSRARQRVRGDVLARFDEVVRTTVPGAAFTGTVLAALAPAPTAAAGTAALTAGSWKAAVGGLGLGAGIGALGILFGYGMAERAIPVERRPALRRARNLSLGGLVAAISLGLLFGEGALVLGLAGFVALLAHVQFRLLPQVLFELTDEELQDPRALRARNLGTVLGALGWAVGAVCGLGGAIWSWWT